MLNYNIHEIMNHYSENTSKDSKLMNYMMQGYLLLSLCMLFWMIINFSEKFLLWIGLYVGHCILLFILTLFISTKIYYNKHVKPMNDIIEKYKINKDPHKLLNKLLTIKPIIVGEKSAVIWKLNVYTALFELGNYDDAIKLLNSIEAKDKALNETIDLEKQLLKNRLIESLAFQLKLIIQINN